VDHKNSCEKKFSAKEVSFEFGQSCWDHGVLVMDKPYGRTSFSITHQVKRTLNVSKAGHLGTLDPFATGILPILCGKATKMMDPLMASSKEYLFTVRFGWETTTDDVEGAVVSQSSVMPLEENIRDVLKDFSGEILQAPPPYSAIKISGVAAYRRARRGEILQMQPRLVLIKDLELLWVKDDQASFRVVCGPGTYVRSLGRDMARALGAQGHLTHIRRTRVGFFRDGLGEESLQTWNKEGLVEDKKDKDLEEKSPGDINEGKNRQNFENFCMEKDWGAWKGAWFSLDQICTMLAGEKD
jgi:tRNA pseudouridine(55) synthase